MKPYAVIAVLKDETVVVWEDSLATAEVTADVARADAMEVVIVKVVQPEEVK